MNVPLAFSPPCPLRTSPATILLLNSSRRCCTTKQEQRRWALIVAATQPPPKRGFYKNPSRAIEKGGGFYVPGLQGPRLRVFVPAVATGFLTLNHLSAGASSGPMARSEGLAVIAAVAVLGTAIMDIMKESKASSDEQNQQVYKSVSAPGEATRGFTGSSRSNSVEWASAVVRDLEPGIEIAHFRNNEMVFSTPSVERTTAGIAVERVVKEQRPLYIAKSSSLPEEVTVPFLGDGEWSILMIPTKGEDVVVFASRRELSRDSRRWLEILSERIAE